MKRSLREIMQDQRNVAYPLIAVAMLANTPCPSLDMVCEFERGVKPTWLGR